jgi:PAS domain-containing protein
MPSEKTKQLLEGLGNIANKTRITEEKHAVVSNEYGEDAKGNIIYIDRMYGDLFGGHRLIQKNHKEYTGKIHKRRRLVKGLDGNSFYSACYETADGRWFDNAGMPIETPKRAEAEPEVQSNIEFVNLPPSAEDLEQIKQQKLEKEQRLLQNLK